MRISDWVQTWALPIYFDEQSIEVVVRSYAGGNCDVMLAGQDTEGAREPGCSIDFISLVQRQGVLMVILENLIRREMDRGMPENSIGTIRSREFCVGFGDWSGRPAEIGRASCRESVCT